MRSSSLVGPIRLRILLVSVASISAVVAFAALAHIGQPAASPTSAERSAVAAPALGVLARPISSGDAVITPAHPSLQAHIFAAAGENAAGVPYIVDVAAARRVYPSAHSQMWVAPGSNGSVCKIIRPLIAATQPAMMHASCYSPLQIAEGHAAAVQGVPPNAEVDGLVPDGVASVTVHLGDGTHVVAPVVNDAYDLTVNRAVVGVSFAAGSLGAVTVPIRSCTSSC